MSTDRKDAFEEDDADDVLNDGVLEGDVEEELGTWFSVHVQPRVQPTQIWGNTNIINNLSSWQGRGVAAKFGFISITYNKYILGVHKYILRLKISTFDL